MVMGGKDIMNDINFKGINCLKGILSLTGFLFLISCNDIAEERVENEKIAVQFSTEIVSRALNNQWEDNDEIGVYMHAYDKDLSDASVFDKSSNCKYLINSEGSMTPATDFDKLYYPQSGRVNFVAYYPFDNVENYLVDVDVSNQTNQAEIDFLYSNNLVNVAAVNAPQKLTFKHQMSKVTFNIKAGYGVNEKDLEGLTVMIRNAASNATVSLVNGNVTVGKEKMDIKALTTATTTSSVTAEAIVVPQTCDKVMIVVTLATGRNYLYNLTTGYQWESGRKYSYEINLTDQTENAVLNAEISDWLDGGSGTVESVTAQAWDGSTINTSWYSADQTSMSLYQPSDLAGLAKLVNEGNSFEGKTIHLSGDLDMNNKAWTPIGLIAETPFKGTFVGNNHQIKNLNPTLTGSNVVSGLFGISYGTIQQLVVSGNYNAAYDKVDILSVGGVCAINYGTVSQCRSFAEIVARMAKSTEEQTILYVGGVVGQNEKRLSDCQNYGSISAENVNVTALAYLHVGGIAGSNVGTITGCENTRTLMGCNGNVRIGGVVGLSAKSQTAETPGKIEDCSNIGDVIIETSHNQAVAGGIVGRNAGGSTIQDVCNKGNIEATMTAGNQISAGGVIGENEASELLSGENRGNIVVVGAVDEDADDDVNTIAIAGGIVGRNFGAAEVHQGTNSGSVVATVSTECYSGGITGYNAVETGTVSKTYSCCVNNGAPIQWVGNATDTDDLITDEEGTVHTND